MIACIHAHSSVLIMMLPLVSALPDPTPRWSLLACNQCDASVMCGILRPPSAFADQRARGPPAGGAGSGEVGWATCMRGESVRFRSRRSTGSGLAGSARRWARSDVGPHSIVLATCAPRLLADSVRACSGRSSSAQFEGGPERERPRAPLEMAQSCFCVRAQLNWCPPEMEPLFAVPHAKQGFRFWVRALRARPHRLSNRSWQRRSWVGSICCGGRLYRYSVGRPLASPAA